MCITNYTQHTALVKYTTPGIKKNNHKKHSLDHFRWGQCAYTNFSALCQLLMNEMRALCKQMNHEQTPLLCLHIKIDSVQQKRSNLQQYLNRRYKIHSSKMLWLTNTHTVIFHHFDKQLTCIKMFQEIQTTWTGSADCFLWENLSDFSTFTLKLIKKKIKIKKVWFYFRFFSLSTNLLKLCCITMNSGTVVYSEFIHPPAANAHWSMQHVERAKWSSTNALFCCYCLRNICWKTQRPAV